MAGTALMDSLPGYIGMDGSRPQGAGTAGAVSGGGDEWKQYLPMFLGMGAGMLGSNYSNPAGKAMPYLEGLEGKISPYYNPFINAGQQGFTHPGEALNQIGANYHQSPGFQFAMQQALQGAAHAANMGGMAGSPQHQFQNMKLASDLASQDYNNYIHNALGLQEGMGGIGFNAANALGTNIGNNEMAKALLAYQGQNAHNQHEGGLGALLGFGGSLLGNALFPGGGGGIGGAVGSALSHIFG